MIKFLSLAALCLFGATMYAQDSLYVIDDSVLIKTKDGAFISALLVRPKAQKAPQSTILFFTIYARVTDINRAKEAASHGYVGIVAYTRGKRYSPDEITPYEYEVRDVNDVIDWISKQSWSDGKVGMYGGSYSGFTQWAATKNLHPALKTIVPAVSVAPGLDVPMTNNVVMSFTFPWTYYVSNNKWLDEKDYRDTVWHSTYFKWYEAGLPYYSLDSVLGRTPNKTFRRWLQHPSYDSYWQNMIPYKNEFSRIRIPILTHTGYYDDGQIGAMYYYREHHKYVRNPEHYLLIGPYGHFGAQATPDTVYKGYRIDSVANISIKKVIYEWFDYILKNKPKPSILKDKVNFEIMGANQWKHASSLSKMSNDTLKLYFSNQPTDTIYLLQSQAPKKQEYLLQTVDYKDRNSMNFGYWAPSVIWNTIDGSGGIVFLSEPMKEDVVISGSFRGQVKVSINKKDFDFTVNLFECLPDSTYFFMSSFMGRASYAKDHSKRQLLTPGKIETIPYSNTYITCKKISKGNRIAVMLNVNKSPFEQINYGTGGDVSRETIKDAGAPLQVKWYTNSFIQIPILK